MAASHNPDSQHLWAERLLWDVDLGADTGDALPSWWVPLHPTPFTSGLRKSAHLAFRFVLLDNIHQPGSESCSKTSKQAAISFRQILTACLSQPSTRILNCLVFSRRDWAGALRNCCSMCMRTLAAGRRSSSPWCRRPSKKEPTRVGSSRGHLRAIVSRPCPGQAPRREGTENWASMQACGRLVSSPGPASGRYPLGLPAEVSSPRTCNHSPSLDAGLYGPNKTFAAFPLMSASESFP